MGTFHADESRLHRNAQLAAEYADDLKSWIDRYDDPAFYDAYATATGFIGAPMTAALREHGRRLREQTHALIARYQQAANASTEGAIDLTTTDEARATGITATTRDL